MPRRPYVPKHRALTPPTESAHPARRTTMVAGAAVCATGLAVSSGLALGGHDSAQTASAEQASASLDSVADLASADRQPVDLGDRAEAVSRSLSRVAEVPAKKRALSQRSGGQVTGSEDLSSKDPRTIAKALLAAQGLEGQFSCLDNIYMHESKWNVHADNPTSSAYGIPQALPGSKMSSAGPDWENNPVTQIKWGIGYVNSRYGSPCAAWGFKQSHGWY